MPFVRRYHDLNTNLDALYKDIKKELQNTKELNIASELSVDVNGVPFKSVIASRISIPRVFLGGLREVTVSITGKPEDYLIELHAGAWFNNIVMPGTGGMPIAGPLGCLAAAGTTGLYAVTYQRTLKNKIKELVKKHSKKEYTADKVETFS